MAGGRILKDEKTATSRSQLVIDGNTARYTTAFWKDGAARYYACTAMVGVEHKALLDAFAKACTTVQVPE